MGGEGSMSAKLGVLLLSPLMEAFHGAIAFFGLCVQSKLAVIPHQLM